MTLLNAYNTSKVMLLTNVEAAISTLSSSLQCAQVCKHYEHTDSLWLLERFAEIMHFLVRNWNAFSVLHCMFAND